MQDKLERLRQVLAGCGKVAVAYSGGVDSTFLMAVAHQVLGDDATALTVRTCLTPRRELDAAQKWCAAQGIRQVVVEVDPWGVEGFAANEPQRCYLCKTALFNAMIATARQQGLGVIVDGSNVDDQAVYRPGRKALEELGVKSPLVEAGFTKAQIRACSKELGLPTWDKPSFACLASRVPYGTQLTPELLARIEQAEALLQDAGFAQMRVRAHGDVARIEVPAPELDKLLGVARDGQLAQRFHELGFAYVTMDLEGFRSGSMDEGLKL